jgi:hypothetical protein
LQPNTFFEDRILKSHPAVKSPDKFIGDSIGLSALATLFSISSGSRGLRGDRINKYDKLKFAEMTEKVFITADNKATFACPNCEKTKTVDISQYKNFNKAIRIKLKCSCGHSHTVFLERRKHYRKETNFPGEYIQIGSGEKKGSGMMTVKNLSRSGMKIQLNVTPNLKVGDRLMVLFHLDDKNKSLIRKETIVRNINDSFIGVQFCRVDEYDKILGFYLFR